MINVKLENVIWKSIFYTFYLLIVHISTKNVFDGLKFWVLVSNIRFEGTVFQIFVLGIFFYFMQKKRVTFNTILKFYFLNFIENEPGPISKV